MTVAVATLPQVTRAPSGPMSPPTASQESAITSLATKTISETLRLNEKDIKTSRWAIALGALAATITILAITTLQPIVIASTLPMAAILTLHAYRGFSDASQKRAHVRFLNDRLAVSQKIEELERDNKPLLAEIKALKISELSKEKAQHLKIELTRALFISQLLEVAEIKEPHSKLEDAHSQLSSELSDTALRACLLNHWTWLRATREALEKTRYDTIEGVRHSREHYLHI